QVFCPHAHVNASANKCFTVTLSCPLLTLTFVYKLQAVCSRNNNFSLVWSLPSLITATLQEPRDSRPCFSAGGARRALRAPQALRGAGAPCGPGGAGSAGQPRPGQRGAVTSSARPRPTRALQFIGTLLALKLIIHHSLSIFEQGLYLRGSRFNHLVSNCFELLPPARGGVEGGA
ncbi:hypothetical protein Nmel_007299, partial [Mimus melanotis]